MTQWVDSLKETIPDYAKDMRLNLDAVIKRSTFNTEQTEAIALAAAFATGKTKFWTWLHSVAQNKKEADAAVSAASLMAMNNVWYPYVEITNDPQLEGWPGWLRRELFGTDKDKFEAYSLAASIVGKCEFCIKSHYDGLKKLGYTVEQLRDIGRIAAVIVSISKIME